MMSLSVYLHVPFCQHRCGYCDFNTYAGLGSLIEPYTQALVQEICVAAQGVGRKLPVHSVFFGGGTPSLLSIKQVEHIIDALEQHFHLLPGVEITLEANPGTLSENYLRALQRLGVNRLSLGVQSANPQELHLLEREHTYLDVIQSVRWARRAGFENLNLDLIFGLPYQALQTWQGTVELVLGLHPEHLSLYALTLEHGTPLEKYAQRGLINWPDSDTAADMYEWAMERLEGSGYQQYEISNWTRRGTDDMLYACQHNLQYWRNLPYLGFGAGAHGYMENIRTVNTLAPATYIQRMRTGWAAAPRPFPCTPATITAQPVDRRAEIGETMMMGLRLVQEGVSAHAFQARFGESLEAVFSSEIRRLEQLGLLEWVGDVDERRLRLTRGGRLLGNRVFMEFLEG